MRCRRYIHALAIILPLLSAPLALADSAPPPAPLVWEEEELDRVVRLEACTTFEDQQKLADFLDTLGSVVPPLDISVETVRDGIYRVCV